MSLRRGLYVVNRAFLGYTRNVVALRGIRFYGTATQQTSWNQNAPLHNETTVSEMSSGSSHATAGTAHGGIDKMDIIEGDFVGYGFGSSKAEGIVLDLFDKPFTDENNNHHSASTASPIVKIENYYTRRFSYHPLNSLQWIARRTEFESDHGKTQTTAAPTTQGNQNQAQSADFKKSQQLARSAEKIDQQLNAPTSPLKIDFAPGDIVRWRVGRNFTAGAILDIDFGKTHDEHGNFHGATREDPMARIEDIFTKKIHYHHLSVLEPVRRASDIEKEHGRYAEAEFGIGRNPQSNKA